MNEKAVWHTLAKMYFNSPPYPSMLPLVACSMGIEFLLQLTGAEPRLRLTYSPGRDLQIIGKGSGRVIVDEVKDWNSNG